MNKEFKRTFFTCLLAVLLIVSNLLGQKFTYFMNITIGVEFVTFPFTFLCTLLIVNYCGKKEAYRSILAASVIQLLITISYTVATTLSTQSLMPDKAIYINSIFEVNQLSILASVLAFIASHCLLIYIYENFKEYNKELYGLAIGLLGALFLNSLLYLGISLNMYEPIYIINLLLSNVIVDIIMIVIIIILFYILKEKHTKVINIKESNKQNINDLSVDEVIKASHKSKENVSKGKKLNNKGKNNTIKNNNIKKNTTGKKTSKSKKIVKKENK